MNDLESAIPNEPPAQASELKVLQDEYPQVVEKYMPQDLKDSPKPVYAVDVGCGFALATKAITDFVGENIHYRGIDTKPLMGAKAWNEDLKGQVVFENADATQREPLGENNDLIIIRNPDVFGSIQHVLSSGGITNEWKKILLNSLESLRTGGYLFLTTHAKNELEAILEFLPKDKTKEIIPLGLIDPSLQSKYQIREVVIALLQKV